MKPASIPNPDSDLIGSDFPPLEPSANANLWDWGDLLDFSIAEEDDQSLLPPHPLPPGVGVTDEIAASEAAERVRKRDPRSSCSNFLAGRVPCSCPELDALDEEDDDALQKKRARVSRTLWAAVRCQVPGCDADISHLKGYHKRHRVCLCCANACSVIVDGETKRYCQQCGKFHVMSDFDEGKRSCRRKLERHNNRRRRKPNESKLRVDREPSMQTVETVCDADNENVSQASSIEKETVEKPESIVEAATPNEVEKLNGECGTSFANGTKIGSNFSLSPSTCDEIRTYSPQCPTGRISFKFYDWNPAEFPRRLREQIFQWLSNMPLELEGYIRPGCTILTAFVAMPRSMWVKLLDNPLMYIHDLCVVPGNSFAGKGPMLIYINNIIYQIMKDGNSLIKVEAKKNAPKLHYIYPSCFEAGKPIEIFACGSNFLQNKFRFLVSFEGRYLDYDSCTLIPSLNDDSISDDHQIYQIRIPQNNRHSYGPAFIEVENTSGLSDFHPILIGDKEICREVKAIQRACRFPNNAKPHQTMSSEFLMDIAWLLKEPSLHSIEKVSTSSNVQRINTLFSFLRCYESTSILKRIIRNLEISMSKLDSTSALSYEMQALKNHVNLARSSFESNFKDNGDSYENDDKSIIEELEVGYNRKDDVLSKVPVVMRLNSCQRGPINLLSSRLTMISVALLAACCVICAVIFHPNDVTHFAVSVNRCLTYRFRIKNSL